MEYFDENNKQDIQRLELIEYLEQQMKTAIAKETYITVHHDNNIDEIITVAEKNRRQIEDIKRLKKRNYLYNQAMEYYKEKNYLKAEQILSNLIKCQKSIDLDVYERLAIIYRKQKKYADEYDILEQELTDINNRYNFNDWVIDKIKERRDKAKLLMKKK